MQLHATKDGSDKFVPICLSITQVLGSVCCSRTHKNGHAEQQIEPPILQ